MIVVPTPIEQPGLPMPDPSDLATWAARMAEMHRWMREVAAPGLSALAATAYENGLDASLSATMAQAAANYSGVWASLSSALPAGRTVFHASKFWVSLVELANVAATTPGTNSAIWWPMDIPATSVSYGAGNVGIALDVINAALAVRSGLRNKAVNGGFRINQRAVSGTVVLAAGAYGHDQWRGGASGCTYTFASSGGVTTITISAGSLVQPIDGAELETGTHVLSWTGTAQGRINGGAYGASGLTGAATAGTDASIEFGIGTVSKVQFELGTLPTPFEVMDPTLDHMRCIRFYERGDFYQVGVNSASAGYGGYVSFKAPKRATPTVSATYANVGMSSMNISVITATGCRIGGVGAAGAVLIAAAWTASALLP